MKTLAIKGRHQGARIETQVIKFVIKILLLLIYPGPYEEMSTKTEQK